MGAVRSSCPSTARTDYIWRPMTLGTGRWFVLIGSIALLIHLVKFVALHTLLWRSHRRGRRHPMEFMAFQFLMVFLLVMPYQDEEASTALNRTLLGSTIAMYVSWIALLCLLIAGQ